MTNGNPDPNEQSESYAFIAISGFELALILAALLIGWWFDFDPRHDMCPGIEANDVARNCLLGLAATLPLFASLFAIEKSSWPSVQRARTFVREHIVPLVSMLTLWQLVFLGICAGIGEELLFRGAIQFALTEWVSLIPAIVITSVLFAIAHFVTWWYAVLAGCASLYFGWLFVATGSLIPPVVAHGVYDIVALIYLTRTAARLATADQSHPPDV